MAILSKAAILAAQDLPTTEVEVPEWGGTVRLRALRVADLGRIREAAGQSDDAFAFALVAASLVGEDGEPLFGANDAEALAGKSLVAFRRVLVATLGLNGLDGGLGKG
jgi:hypothetical protein